MDLAPLLAAIQAKSASMARPVLVALDGPSGAGKSTLAPQLGSAVISGDDFFAGGVLVRDDHPAQRAADCIDWRRQRPVLGALRDNRPATWRAFDWQAFDGRLEETLSECRPESVVVLEGVYSARPELADLIDLRVLLSVSEPLRQQRLLAREGSLGPWELQWHEAERYYFSAIAPSSRFDFILVSHNIE